MKMVEPASKPDLRTRYLGLELESPVVASASPLGASVEGLLRLEEAGAAAVVMPSLFEEQIEHHDLHAHHAFGAPELEGSDRFGYLPALDSYNSGPRAYLDHLAGARRALRVPVIASLNGSTEGGWIRYARLLEEAGAQAIELNIHFVPTSTAVSGEEVEARYLEVVSGVRRAIGVPLAVKVGPFFSSLPAIARRLVEAGADGLVLFNRFLEPDIDLDRLQVRPALRLSTPDELRLSLRWVAVLSGRIPCSLAASTGVHRAEDALKLLLAGADVTMMASALLLNGPERLREVREGIVRWLEEHQEAGVEQIRGRLAQRSIDRPADYERATYVRAVTSYDRSVGTQTDVAGA